MAERAFPIETIVSCVAFYKIENNIPVMASDFELAKLLAFMGGTSPLPYMTDRIELIVGASVCGLALVKQHAPLGEVQYPYAEYRIDSEHFAPWIASIYAFFGTDMIVQSAEDLELTNEERGLLDEVNLTLKERFNL